MLTCESNWFAKTDHRLTCFHIKKKIMWSRLDSKSKTLREKTKQRINERHNKEFSDIVVKSCD